MKDDQDNSCAKACSDVAVLRNEIEHLHEEKERLDNRVTTLEEDRIERDKDSARLKGGAAVLITLGSLAGTVLAKFDEIKSFLKIGG